MPSTAPFPFLLTFHRPLCGPHLPTKSLAYLVLGVGADQIRQTKEREKPWILQLHKELKRHLETSQVTAVPGAKSNFSSAHENCPAGLDLELCYPFCYLFNVITVLQTRSRENDNQVVAQ